MKVPVLTNPEDSIEPNERILKRSVLSWSGCHTVFYTIGSARCLFYLTTVACHSTMHVAWPVSWVGYFTTINERAGRHRQYLSYEISDPVVWSKKWITIKLPV
jgi:hypothetical protein